MTGSGNPTRAFAQRRLPDEGRQLSLSSALHGSQHDDHWGYRLDPVGRAEDFQINRFAAVNNLYVAFKQLEMRGGSMLRGSMAFSHAISRIANYDRAYDKFRKR